MARPTTIYVDPEKLLRGIHRESVRQFGIHGNSHSSFWELRQFKEAGVRINFEVFVGEPLTKTQSQKYAAALRDLERQGLVTVWDSIRAMRAKITEAGKARLRELGVAVDSEKGPNGD
jgi:hypothetical protein